MLNRDGTLRSTAAAQERGVLELWKRVGYFPEARCFSFFVSCGGDIFPRSAGFIPARLACKSGLTKDPDASLLTTAAVSANAGPAREVQPDSALGPRPRRCGVGDCVGA